MGTVVISVDAELAWGYHDRDEFPEKIERARDGWLKLIDLFDEFEIPATWAIVGHLFLDECDGTHEELASPEDWFSRDPGGTANETSVWFGPDLVWAVRNAEVNHEIGSHAFSHIEFGDSRTTREIADSELRSSVRIAKKWDLDLESFVFPRNSIGHRECLAEHGFYCYRGNGPSRWYDGSLIYPLGKVTSMIWESPPIVEPHVDEYGLINIPASIFLFTFDRPLGPLTEPMLGDVIVRKAKNGIDSAGQGGGVFHMWLHPNDLIESCDIDRMRQILRYLDRERGVNNIKVKTMRQIASEVSPG